MPDLKVTARTALGATELAAGDLLNVVDISDTTMAASGTNKKIPITDLFGAIPVDVSLLLDKAIHYGDPIAVNTWQTIRDGTKLVFNRQENTTIATVDASPTAGGTGYTLNDVLTLSEGAGGTVTVDAVNSGVVTTVSLTTAGDGYTTGAGKATTGGTGTGATIEILTLALGFVEKGFFDSSFHTNKIVLESPGSISDPAIQLASDTGLFLQSLGVIGLTAAGVECARFAGVTSAVNCFLFTPSIASSFPIFEVEGTDTNISLLVRAKGSGDIVLDSNLLINNGLSIKAAVGEINLHGVVGGNVGGFASGNLHVVNTGTAQFTGSVITGHSLFNTNTQLWWLGSISSSDDDIALINRQNGDLSFWTNGAQRLLINAGAGIDIASDLSLTGSAVRALNIGDGIITLSTNTGNQAFLNTTDFFHMLVGGFNRLNLNSIDVVFNEGGDDVDFRIESDTLTHALFLNGATGQVGINTPTVLGAAEISVLNNAAGFTFRNSAGTVDERTFSLVTDANSLKIAAYNDADEFQRFLVSFGHDGETSFLANTLFTTATFAGTTTFNASVTFGSLIRLVNGTTSSIGAMTYDQANKDLIVGDGAGTAQRVHMGAWKSWTPTFTGFSTSPVVSRALYTRIGDLVCVRLDMGDGTSNSTVMTVTIPLKGAAGSQFIMSTRARDNGGGTGSALLRVDSNTTMTCFKTGTEDISWTASGGKSINGNFFYVTDAA